MITLTILLIVALLCVLVGCLTGLLTLVGVLASLFVGEFLFGLLGIHASGSFSSFAISVIGTCICIWIGQKISE